jgi:hypothetical protein
MQMEQGVHGWGDELNANGIGVVHGWGDELNANGTGSSWLG